MPKLPRGISSDKLIKKLKLYQYEVVRQSGSHIRLVSNKMGKPHYITIPKKSALKVGTLNCILKEISKYLKITKEQLIIELFEN